ncbi:MAG: hypothetical protein NC231_02490 [Bacillus sp. (in: Bacteria)]|nr:hypothetical protein [Bacillus sp. (in: firmicutes)]MCM1425545.1 hypothetical protein [Eubacterium sp.]
MEFYNMKIRCVYEHNGDDTILYADNFIGAYTRGASLKAAMEKMNREIASYLDWSRLSQYEELPIEIVQEKQSDLQICDADSDVIFDTEKGALIKEEYEKLKELALQSAQDFLALYEDIPDKNKSSLPYRTTFYGDVPRTAEEMYQHTKNVNDYYFGEIGIETDNEGTIAECRKRGFELLEQTPDYLENKVYTGSYDEDWSLRKVLRRFIWHDRIHAKAMYRMAVKTFGENAVPNRFHFT